MKSPFVYEVSLPADIESGKKYPVVFALHGIGFNEKDMLTLVQDLKEDFILIGIRGHLSYENGHAYYYLKEYGKPERDLFDNSIKMLTDFIDYASSKYPIDPTKRYLLGFSQGAILSLSLALILGDTIKGIVAMHGYIPSFVKEEYPIKSIENISVFISDGETDPIFPPTIGQESYDYLCEHVGSIKYTTYPVGHEVSPDHQRDLVAWLEKDALTKQPLK